jgi:uncharacterized membrane protein YgdD (TMEM256/DUF423 family)
MNYAQIACISLAISIILGSMGAHAMKPHLTTEAFNSWDTAVKYQVYQSLGLLALFTVGKSGIVRIQVHRWAMLLIALGMLCFSGSLYLRSSSPVTGIDFSWLGPIAPIGGIFLILGWLLAAVSFVKEKKIESR